MPVEAASTIAIRRSTRPRGADVAIAELAEGQHGLVTREQLGRLGLKGSAVDRRLRAGRLHRIRPAVFSVGHRLLTREGRWMAAILASGPEAVLSHWSAAALWAIRPNSRSVIDVTVPRKSRSWDGIERHHKPLPADEVTIERGLPTTTAPRTILDLAASESPEMVQSLLREAEFRQVWDRLSLWDLIERYPGRRGVRRVRAALERLSSEPPGERRSPLEERFVPFLRRHRLPMPHFNAWIALGDKRFQVDCHWPDSNQIVELDGWAAHGSRSAFREDRGRDRRFRAAGYSVIRITWSELDDEPEAIASDLRVLLGLGR